MRTGHRDLKSLKSYQNLRGGEGKRQQQDILGSESKASISEGTQTVALSKPLLETVSDDSEEKTTVHPAIRSTDQPQQSSSAGKIDENVSKVLSKLPSLSGFSGVSNMTGGTVNVTFNYHHHSGKPV